jgi:hypothetical protein
MNNKTAVEWLFDMINNPNDNQVMAFKLLTKAKEIEREQIVEACNSQKNDYRGMPTYNKSGEQYYNETYGGNNE